MIIKTTRDALELAIKETAERFAGNIEYRNGPEPITTRAYIDNKPYPFAPDARLRYRLTITVRDSKGAGASISRGWMTEGRAIGAACWHVHGFYFDCVLAADPLAVIRPRGNVIDANGGNWQDFQRGSAYLPSMASEWCDHTDTGESLAADLGYRKGSW